MTMSDSLSDMLTRIRNGLMARKQSVHCPSSKLKNNVLEVLKANGFIAGYEVVGQDHGQMVVDIQLKYSNDGEPAIREIKRVSKPGCRTYSKVEDLRPVYNGLGIAILSTTKGVMSDHDARASHVGGEILAEVF